MSIEKALDSLAACLGHARVSKTDRVWSGSKIGRKLWSWKLLGSFSRSTRSAAMKTLAAVIIEVEVNGVHLK